MSRLFFYFPYYGNTKPYKKKVGESMPRIIRLALRWGPVLYPVVRKILKDRKKKQSEFSEPQKRK
jgi:hypothetical protein